MDDAQSASMYNDLAERLTCVEDDLSKLQDYARSEFINLHDAQIEADRNMLRLGEAETKIDAIQDAMKHQFDRDIAAQQTERTVSNILDQVSALRQDLSETSKRSADVESRVDAYERQSETRMGRLHAKVDNILLPYESKQRDIEETILQLHGTAKAIGSALEQLDALRQERPSAQDLHDLASQLQEQHQDLKKARSVHILFASKLYLISAQRNANCGLRGPESVPH